LRVKDAFIGQLVLVSCLFAAPGALAQERTPTPDVLRQIHSCANVSNAAERLACFDGAERRLREAEERGEFAGVDRAQAQEVQRESFGFALPSVSRLLPRVSNRDNESSAVDNVQMTVERVIARANGYHAFVMTNGQVWAQVQAERASNVRTGTNVTVRKAIAGSYMMSSERGGSAHRVRREQ
jgi:hypothetical protein